MIQSNYQLKPFILKVFNVTGRYWVGASDFEDEGEFTWFHNRTMPLDLTQMKHAPVEDKDQRCIQVG
jgi:hypothetical protein